MRAEEKTTEGGSWLSRRFEATGRSLGDDPVAHKHQRDRWPSAAFVSSSSTRFVVLGFDFFLDPVCHC